MDIELSSRLLARRTSDQVCGSLFKNRLDDSHTMVRDVGTTISARDVGSLYEGICKRVVPLNEREIDDLKEIFWKYDLTFDGMSDKMYWSSMTLKDEYFVSEPITLGK